MSARVNSTFSTRARPRLLASLAAGLAPVKSGFSTASAAVKPDILVLILNDVRDGDQAAMPQAMAWLQGRGTTFPNFMMTTPLCGPSRSCLLTGLYSHNHGVYDNSDGKTGGWVGFAKHGNRTRTTGLLLQAAGYRTIALGNYINGEQPGRGMEPGWNVGPVAKGKKHKGKGKGKGKHKKKKKHQQGGGGMPSDAQLVGTAAAELRGAASTQPLYLHIGLGTAHVPLNPASAYTGRFSGAQVAREASFNEADISDKSAYLRRQRGLSAGDEAWLDGLHQLRLAALAELDDALLPLWQAIEARGKADNTYVFLVSDNGYMMGHHRYYGKIVPYDRSARFPLQAVGPGFAAGATDARVVGNIDIAPTIVAVAGANRPSMDGVSLLSGNSRDAILLENLSGTGRSMKWPGPRADIPRYRALRTPTHLYVEYGANERELYNYATDPFETSNLLAGTPTPGDAALAATLANRLQQLG